MKITYAVTVCNESQELNKLLTFLIEHKDPQDNIVLLHDVSKANQETFFVLEKFKENKNILQLSGSFEGHFGCWKNKLKLYCNGDYIFFLDADEIPTEFLISNVKQIISNNKNKDMFYIPRINTVEGLTQDHIKKWKLNVNEKKWINFPDYQIRLIKNVDYIHWINQVHEHLTGAKQPTLLPAEESFCIIHEKQIVRQEKQNASYELLQTSKLSKKLNIIYRTCDSVSVTSSANQKRDFGTKQQIIKACFNSVIKALKNFNQDYNLIVVADHISMDLKQYFETYTEISEIVETTETGNGASFAKCLDVGLSCFGDIFFLEDDYFVDINIFNEMVYFKNKIINNPKFLHKNICLYPLDEDWYDNKPEKTTILTGLERHWKSISHTCCTFLIDDVILIDQLSNLQKYKYYGTPHINNNNIEDHTINMMYKKYPCFSPIPALAEHLQFINCLSPFSKFKDKNYTCSILQS